MVSSKIEPEKLAGTSFDLLQLLELKEEFEHSKKVKLELEKELSISRLAFQAELKHVQDELGQSKAELAKSKLAIGDKDNELHRLSEQLHLARLQHFQYEESVCNLQGEVMFLGLKLQNLEADSKKSKQQLKNQYYKSMDEWMAEKVNLMLQITYLEQQLQQNDKQKAEFTVSRRCSDCLSFEKGHQDDKYASLWYDSSTSHGSIQSLVELGEAFHVGDEELQHLRTKLKDAETRESHIVLQLQNQTEKLPQLETEIGLLKEELQSEKEKFREESEDMAQEMAELRYQFTEMLEVERDLRARTEHASVHRVEELEAQVDRARKQLVAALAKRREAELQLENLELKILHLNEALESERHQRQEYTETKEREKENFQLKLRKLEESFSQLEKEKKLMEAHSIEHLENCNRRAVLCLLSFDNERNGLSSIGNAQLAQFDKSLLASHCKSDSPEDGRHMGTMDDQVMLECKCFLGNRSSCAYRQKLIEHLEEELATFESRHAQYEKLLMDENEVENAIQYGLKLDIQLLVLSGSFELEMKRCRDKLIESEKKTMNARQILEEKELEMEQIWKQVDRFKLEFSQYQESVANREDEIVFLREELGKSDAEWEKSYHQLNEKHAERIQECKKERIPSLLKSSSVEEQPQETLLFGDNAPYRDIEIQTNCANTKVPQAVTFFDKEIVPSDDAVTLHEMEGYFQDLVALGEASLVCPDGEEHYDRFELTDAGAS